MRLLLRDLKNKNVYHGSSVEVKTIDLSCCKKGKDFGQGFYITTDRQQAIKFVNVIVKRENLYQGVLNIYKLSNLDDLKVYEFESANREWFNYVVGNRDRRFKNLAYFWKDFDVLIGKIADDNTSQVINAYLAGVFGIVGSEEAIQFAISRFMPEKLNNQLCFKTKKAIERLQFFRGVRV